jgi:polysaccharide biosynthesis transport protein
MTLRDYWEILRQSWLMIVATTLLGALGALGVSLLMTPIYQAQAQLFVSVRAAAEIATTFSGGSYVQQRVKSYLDVVDSPGVLGPVIRQLGLDVTPVELAPSVAAQNPPNTVLLTVTGSDPSPALAAKLTNATAEALADEIVRLETTESSDSASERKERA